MVCPLLTQYVFEKFNRVYMGQVWTESFCLEKQLCSWRDERRFLNIEKGQNNIKFTQAIWSLGRTKLCFVQEEIQEQICLICNASINDPEVLWKSYWI